MTDTAPIASAILKYGRWSVNANTDLPPASVSYLLHNGFTQSMTDAAAATREDKAKLLYEHGLEADAAKMEDGDKSLSDAAKTVLASAADQWRQERFDAIMAGTVGVRASTGGTSRARDPLERIMHQIAVERVRALCAAKGKPMAKGDVLKQAVEIILKKQGEAIRAQAQAQLDANAALEDGDIGDLLDAPVPQPDGTPSTTEMPANAA